MTIFLVLVTCVFSLEPSRAPAFGVPSYLLHQQPCRSCSLSAVSMTDSRRAFGLPRIPLRDLGVVTKLILGLSHPLLLGLSFSAWATFRQSAFDGGRYAHCLKISDEDKCSVHMLALQPQDFFVEQQPSMGTNPALLSAKASGHAGSSTWNGY